MSYALLQNFGLDLNFTVCFCVSAFKTIFMEFDHDQDGLLLPDQLTEALRYLRIDVNDSVLQEVMSFLKINGEQHCTRA